MIKTQQGGEGRGRQAQLKVTSRTDHRDTVASDPFSRDKLSRGILPFMGRREQGLERENRDSELIEADDDTLPIIKSTRRAFSIAASLHRFAQRRRFAEKPAGTHFHLSSLI